MSTITRERLIDVTATAITDTDDDFSTVREAAEYILDAILAALHPEVATTEELAALPPGSVIREPDGAIGMVMVARDKRRVIGWPGTLPVNELDEVVHAACGDPLTVIYRRDTQETR
ncbi:hypothetical protein LCL87_24980 [Rhodococcus hoagii]|nr:hypothetical protein [Prescottella equi]